MKKILSVLAYQLVPWVIPLGLALGWQTGVTQGWISSRVLPAPIAIVQALFSVCASGALWQHLEISCLRALAGFSIGSVLGLVLGFATGCSSGLERWLDTSIQMVRNIPHLALIPLVILWFGIGEEAKLFLIALGVLFPVYLNTFHARGRLFLVEGWGLLFRSVCIVHRDGNIRNFVLLIIVTICCKRAISCIE